MRLLGSQPCTVPLGRLRARGVDTASSTFLARVEQLISVAAKRRRPVDRGIVVAVVVVVVVVVVVRTLCLTRVFVQTGQPHAANYGGHVLVDMTPTALHLCAGPTKPTASTSASATESNPCPHTVEHAVAPVLPRRTSRTACDQPKGEIEYVSGSGAFCTKARHRMFA